MDVKPVENPEKNKKNSGVLINLAVGFGAVLLSLILIEGAVRIGSGLTKKTKWGDRPQFYYAAGKAGEPQGGFYEAKKPAGTYRVAVVGDSVSYGPYLQYDDTFARRLERMLNLNGGARRVEVINYGVSGYSTREEIRLARQAVSEEADFIILQITLNDAEMEPLDIKHEKNAQRFGTYSPGPFMQAVFRYSKTAGIIANRLHNSKTHREYKKYFKDLFEDKKSFGIFKESLEKIKASADRGGVPLAAVIFPLFGTTIDGSYPFRGIHGKIRKTLSETDIPHLDLLKSYKNIPSIRLQVVPGSDFHPNEIGHRIAAEAIYTWLFRRKLLPEEFRIRNTTIIR